jgi:Alternative complex III, ActD subunit
MSDRMLVAKFAHAEDLLGSAVELRRKGYIITDAFTPYAVHGLDRALGLKPSRLTWVCFICGMIGGLGMLYFEYWVGAISWPIDVGGKPWNSLPSTVPVAFETAVLLAGFGSVFALLGVSPGKQACPLFKHVTDDRFVLVLDEADARFDASLVEAMLRPFNLLELEERVVAAGGVRP